MIQPAEIGRMGYPDLPGRNRVTVASGLASDVQPGPGTVPRSRIVGDAGERPAHLDRDGPLALPMRAPRSMRSPRYCGPSAAAAIGTGRNEGTMAAGAAIGTRHRRRSTTSRPCGPCA